VPSDFVVGLIGDGIGASLTPPLHEAEAAALGLRYEYRTFDLIQLGLSASAVGPMLAEARELGYAAMNITHPCKQLALEAADELDPDARRLGAVNLVAIQDGLLVGYNTDWIGFRDALLTGLVGAELSRVVQVGCGGAGAATAYALLNCGVEELTLVDVDRDRAETLGERMRDLYPEQSVRVVAREGFEAAVSGADGVVHATPVGMAHHPGVAFPIESLPAHAWVSDVVYRPLETELIRRAAAAGHRVLDGGRMAVGQALASLQIITGLTPDRARMDATFRSLVHAEAETS
jgi:shikimate dehydrogenase